MKYLVRLCGLVLIVSGIAVIASNIGDAYGDKGQSRPSAQSRSHVTLSEDTTGSLVSYRVVAGDALVIRFRNAKMTGCTLKIHTGPRTGSEHAGPEIAIAYRIVPIDRWQAEVKELGQGCGEYWYSID